mgnify:CR=1 FL=1
MRFIFSLLVLGTLTACNSNAPVKVDGVEVSMALRRSADGQHFDYTGYLAKALHSDGEALEKLLQFVPDADSVQIAHGAVLRSVLARMGDAGFAAAVAKQPTEIKTIVWAALEREASRPVKALAPATRDALVPPASAEEHRGLYVFDEKLSTFRDCGTPEKRYVAVDETGNIEKNYRRLLRYPYPGQSIFAEVKGFVAPYYGNLSKPANYAGFFVVTEIIELETKNYRNTCLPYDYWALGTEPFWYAQISEAEGVIEFRGMDDERTKVFTYVAPVMEADSSLVYSAINQNTGDNIRITVQEESCSDGMSEIEYRFSVKMTMNGKEFLGCGIKFGSSPQ